MSKTKNQVMNFIPKDRMRRFQTSAVKVRWQNSCILIFLKRWLILFWLHLKSELIRGVAIKVIMQQSWHSKAKTKKFVM